MKLFKHFMIAVLIALAVSYSLGQVVTDGVDVSVAMDGLDISESNMLIGIGAFAVVLIVLGFLVAMSVIGAVVIAIFVAFASILIAGISAFWPSLLLLAFVVWLMKDKSRQASMSS